MLGVCAAVIVLPRAIQKNLAPNCITLLRPFARIAGVTKPSRGPDSAVRFDGKKGIWLDT